MKFTLSWLKDHLETDASIDTIVDQLTAIGLEVEGVEDRAAALAPFRIARVVDAKQHPNADRLRVLTVDPGDEGCEARSEESEDGSDLEDFVVDEEASPAAKEGAASDDDDDCVVEPSPPKKKAGKRLVKNGGR